MAKVVKMKGKKKLDVYQIEGDGFRRINEIYARCDAITEETEAFIERQKEVGAVLKKELWDAIHAEVGRDLENSYSLNLDYTSLGFLLVEKHKHNAITDLLENLGGYRG